jgi:DNA-binding PadR family transcriptional regulator
MKRINRTKQVVLGFLKWRPMSGYDIKRLVEQSISNFWSESFGQIYPTLRALVGEGLATLETTEVDGSRKRHVYAITPQGREALRRWLQAPVQPTPNRSELLLKLFFSGKAGKEDVVDHIEAHKGRIISELQRYRAIGERLDTEYGNMPDVAYWRLTAEYGRMEAEAHLAWCRKALETLEMSDCDPDPSRAAKPGQ